MTQPEQAKEVQLGTFESIAEKKGIPTPNANWIKAFAENQKALKLFEQMAQQANEVGDIDSQAQFEELAEKTREQIMIVMGKLTACSGCTGCGD
jgi:formylmethanofuran dehydrogenase subunit A